ncbi:phage tail sheath C-terminal domain-containing protein [Roseitranquillus sediminis]|uniref:phage tail sheath C-terminal domain-containing protein n=1 Tax=Roseitranquillus sediminis TaxID=2809051 RepID=UPI001D0CC1B7|nr:phage tail sheath C-terminal domain-containing protein [Roseitranquillus sediminis]MBM9594989.1 phage tail sheath subtilisin-like domain-containing protein [Roseitranquillus sediminis]
MVQVSYPGVYIVEKSSGVKTITGVATSIGAFFGRTQKGPINKPVRCLSYADFLRTFGGAHPESELAASLSLFFANGGSDTYVVRLAGAGAQAAGIDLENLAGNVVLRATAKVAGVWGNGVRLEVGYNTPNPGESFSLTVIQEEGGREVAREVHQNLVMDPTSPRFAPSFVTQSSALVRLAVDAGLDLNAGSFPGFSEARRPLGTDLAGVQATLDGLIAFGNPSGARRFEISVNGSAYVAVDLSTLDVNDAGIGDIGALEDVLRDRINNALAALVPAQTVEVSLDASAEAGGQRFLRITATSGDTAKVRVRRAAASDLAGGLMLGVDNGGVEMARRSDFRPAPTGSLVRLTDDAGNLTALNTLAGMDQSDLTGVTIGSETPIPLDAAPNDIQTTGGGDPFTTDALSSSANGNNDGVREKLKIISQAISNAPGSRYRAELHGHDLVVLAKDGTFNETPSGIAFAGPEAGTADGFVQLNSRQYTLGPNGTSDFVTFNAATQTGADGGAPGFPEYVGDPVQKTGFHALDPVDLVNLFVLPADHAMTEAERRALWGPASIYAQSRRAFLLIDSPDSWTDAEGRPAVVQNTDDVNNMRATVVKDHSAVFYPRVLFNDGGLVKAVGSTGAIAGLMARTDATRGVWKAPAGTEADIRNIVGLNASLTDLENGVLNKLGVNCARQFVAGFVNWGARTLDGSDDLGSEWKYIPIRRLALMIEESLYRGTQWVVFEPNDEPLWAKIRLNVGVFMNGLFRQGAFQGSTPSDAYFVKCDGETTTQADRNLGIVNIEVGFAPLKPAEFVVITIQQIAGDLS